MIARFCRFFPAYTAEAVLAMEARRFFALNRCIPRLDAEEEARAITVQHNSKPADRLKELIDRIKGIEHSQPSIALVLKGEAGYEDTEGEIKAIRERQRAASDEMKRDPKAWLEQQKQKIAQAQASS